MSEEVYYLANFHYGELKIAVGLKELMDIRSSKDSWEQISKEQYDQLRIMYLAGRRDVTNEVLRSIR